MKALIAMSGGVDSSVAAYLAQREGYECIGCTMKLYDNEDAGISEGHTCCSLDDVEDARSVAYRLGMPLLCVQFFRRFPREGHRCRSAEAMTAGPYAEPLHRLQPAA